MNNHHTIRLTAALLIAAALPLCAIAQSNAAAKQVPRAADGKPDLSGVWIATGALRLMAGEAELAAARQFDIAAGRAPAPPAEPPPYTPEADKRRQYYLDRRGIDDPMARCLISGVPRISFRPLPFQIVQMPGQMIFLYETHHAFRIIPTDGRAHPDDIEPSYLGDSVARWDGDTLVVDVTRFTPYTWFDRSGNFHSDGLHVTERYTALGRDAIQYEARIEDAKVFTRPWTIRLPLYRRIEPNAQLIPFRCMEMVEETALGHLRKEPLVKRWEGKTMVVDITRKVPASEEELYQLQISGNPPEQ